MNMTNAISRFLLPRGRAAARALAATIVADDPEIMTRVDLDAVADRMNAHLEQYPTLVLALCKLLLLALEYGPAPRAAKFGRFSRQSPEKRLACVARWEHSGLAGQRNAFKLLKIIALTSLLHERDLLDHMGYDDVREHRLTRPDPRSDVPDVPCKLPGT